MTAYDAQGQTEHSVDVLASSNEEGQSVDSSEQETGTTNDDGKDWRKSQKTWQEMAEKAKKGEEALAELNKMKQALGVTPQDSEQSIDPVQVLQAKLADLELKAELSAWEKSHPAVDTEANREAWQDIIKTKSHLVRSGELTWDDLWAIVRKSAPKSTTAEKFESQNQNIGSVPPINSPRTETHGIDPEVYRAMKSQGWTERQIKESGL